MPLFGKRKIEVTREEFAKVLLVWVSRSLSDEKIKQIARASAIEQTEETVTLFGLNLHNKVDMDRLLQELFVFEMWSTVVNCEADVGKRDECLDTFHRLVYEEFLKGRDEDFEQWLLSMGERYQEYNEAMKTGHPRGSLWGLATLLNEKLYGQLNLDAFIQFQIANYIDSSMNACKQLIEDYEVN